MRSQKDKTLHTEFDSMNVPTETSATMNYTSDKAVAVPFSFTDEEVVLADKHVKKITAELNKADKAFTQVACEIKWLYVDSRYKAVETSSTFEEFVSNRFNIKKTQAYALVNLVDRFGEQDDKGNFAIKKDFIPYGQSKLSLMCGLTDEQIRDNIKPSMSVRDLRKIVKALKTDDSLENSERSENVSESDSDTTVENESDSVVDSVAVSEKTVMEIGSYTDFDSFVSDYPNLSDHIKEIFGNYGSLGGLKIVISYEHDNH